MAKMSDVVITSVDVLALSTAREVRLLLRARPPMACCHPSTPEPRMNFRLCPVVVCANVRLPSLRPLLHMFLLREHPSPVGLVYGMPIVLVCGVLLYVNM
jgi:hypothetical protein